MEHLSLEYVFRLIVHLYIGFNSHFIRIAFNALLEKDYLIPIENKISD